MPDSPEQLAKLLAELEAEKAALQTRLTSLETVISGIHSLLNSPADIAQDERGFVLVRESTTFPPHAAPAQKELRQNVPWSDSVTADAGPTNLMKPEQIVSSPENDRPAEPDKSLRQHAPEAPPERRRPAKLNIYVNQNAEWAARQLITTKVSRSALRRKTGHRCPSCGSNDTRISLSRGVSDLFMFLFDYTSARCRNCDTRFRIWRSHPDEEEHEPSALTEPGDSEQAPNQASE